MNKILIGSHVSMAKPDYLLGSLNEALSYGANTFMIYTGAPQNSLRTPINQLKLNEF
jgi:deoxyribonuclease-4